jgi:hypothetical protein
LEEAVDLSYDRLLMMMRPEYVYCVVRTGSLNKKQIKFRHNRLKIFDRLMRSGWKKISVHFQNRTKHWNKLCG